MLVKCFVYIVADDFACADVKQQRLTYKLETEVRTDVIQHPEEVIAPVRLCKEAIQEQIWGHCEPTWMIDTTCVNSNKSEMERTHQYKIQDTPIQDTIPTGLTQNCPDMRQIRNGNASSSCCRNSVLIIKQSSGEAYDDD